MGEAVSVVIPCRNDAGVLRDQLEALARQSVACAEVIVADNGPTDGLADVVSAFGDLPVRVIDAADRRGRAHACNVGARAATSPLLLFVDADDVVDDHYVEHMAEALATQPFVAARLDVERLNDPLAQCYRRPPQLTGLGEGHRSFAYGCSLGIRREAFDGVGGFDATIGGAGEDIDFCYRAASAGIDLAFVEGAVVHYRLRRGLRSIWRQAVAYGAGDVAVYRRHGPTGMPRPGGPGPWKAALRALASLDGCRRRRGLYLLAVRIGTARALRER